MKGTIIFITSFILSFVAFGQKYHPFPKDNATWSEMEWVDYAFGPKAYDCFTNHYGLQGDTLIANVRYSKLYSMDPNYKILDPNKFSLLREDSTRKVWHRYSAADTSERLLIDFGLQLGDTFGSYQVVQIDSVSISGQYRRRIRFDCSFEEFSFIEGIGSITGLIQMPSCATNYFHILNCFRENGNIIYQHPSQGGSCHCDTRTGINADHIQNTNKVNINPNPFTDQLNLTFPYGPAGSIHIELLTSDGKLIRSFEGMKNDQPLDLSELGPGLYMLKIVSMDWIEMERIVKVMP